MSASIHEIAAAAECSIATVSRVFNQRPHVRNTVRRRVLEAARNLGYSPKLTARHDAIAIVTENFDTEPMGAYETVLTALLVRTLSRTGQRVEIIPNAELEVFQEKFFQGMISLLYQPEHIDNLVHLGKQHQLPLVCINHRIPGMHSVCSDEFQGIHTAVDLLTSYGHREIGLILKTPDTASTRLRKQSFCEIMTARQLPCDHILSLSSVEEVTEGVLKLLLQPVSALIVGHEDFGLAVSYALTLARKNIPRTLSLVAMESPNISRFCSPAQTVIAQDFPRIAMEAVRLLRSDSDAVKESLLLPYKLIERDSVGRYKPEETGNRERKLS